MKVFERFKNTNLASMYNYSLVIHDAWVFLSAIQKQMVKLYGDMNDIPEDFSNLYEKDLPMMIEYLKQWHPKKIHNCSCGNGSKKTDKQFCPLCFTGKTGGRLKEYVELHKDDL